MPASVTASLPLVSATATGALLLVLSLVPVMVTLRVDEDVAPAASRIV